MALLEIKNLKLDFVSNDRSLRAVDDVSLTINAGETVCLVGESGCGKSVTALSIARLVPTPPARYVGGEILLNGQDVLKMSKQELRGIRGGVVSYIFQDPSASLNPVFRVGNQIKESLKLHRPEKALDVTIQAQILELLLDLKKRLGMSILLITHNLGIVGDIADRVAVMYAGQVVEMSPALELLRRPLHPYTKALMYSVPKLSGNAERLLAIGGNVPTLGNFPSGCRFYPRCPTAHPECATTQPPLVEVSPKRWVRCLYPKEL